MDCRYVTLDMRTELSALHSLTFTYAYSHTDVKTQVDRNLARQYVVPMSTGPVSAMSRTFAEFFHPSLFLFPVRGK